MGGQALKDIQDIVVQRCFFFWLYRQCPSFKRARSTILHKTKYVKIVPFNVDCEASNSISHYFSLTFFPENFPSAIGVTFLRLTAGLHEPYKDIFTCYYIGKIAS